MRVVRLKFFHGTAVSRDRIFSSHHRVPISHKGGLCMFSAVIELFVSVIILLQVLILT